MLFACLAYRIKMGKVGWSWLMACLHSALHRFASCSRALSRSYYIADLQPVEQAASPVDGHL